MPLVCIAQTQQIYRRAVRTINVSSETPTRSQTTQESQEQPLIKLAQAQEALSDFACLSTVPKDRLYVGTRRAVVHQSGARPESPPRRSTNLIARCRIGGLQIAVTGSDVMQHEVAIRVNELVRQTGKLRYVSRGQFSFPLVVLAMAGGGWAVGAQHNHKLHNPGVNAQDRMGFLSFTRQAACAELARRFRQLWRRRPSHHWRRPSCVLPAPTCPFPRAICSNRHSFPKRRALSMRW
jgi:hypothetical protein